MFLSFFLFFFSPEDYVPFMRYGPLKKEKKMDQILSAKYLKNNLSSSLGTWGMDW